MRRWRHYLESSMVDEMACNVVTNHVTLYVEDNPRYDDDDDVGGVTTLCLAVHFSLSVSQHLVRRRTTD